MDYEKPEFIAQNSAEGSFAAGCPAMDRGYTSCPNLCVDCERTA